MKIGRRQRRLYPWHPDWTDVFSHPNDVQLILKSGVTHTGRFTKTKGNSSTFITTFGHRLPIVVDQIEEIIIDESFTF